MVLGLKLINGRCLLELTDDAFALALIATFE